VSSNPDPLRNFFDEIHFRLDLHPTLAPAGDVWPELETFELFKVWLRGNQQRRELELLKQRPRLEIEELRAQIQRLRAWIGNECPACGGLVAYGATAAGRVE
jgi:hypothetical protein